MDPLLQADLQHLIHPLHNRRLHESSGKVWARGEGALLYDTAGKPYLDALSGLWNVTAGHGRQELVEAAASQMKTLPYCSGYAGSTHPKAIELAERLAAITYPSITRFFFTSGGGESADTIFKTARYYWRLKGKPEKTKVISRQFGYHGTTMAAMSATGLSSYWPMFEPRVPGFVQIPSPYPYRYEPPAGTPAGVTPGIAAANELEQAILREGPDTVGVFLVEPVQGSGGVIVPPDDYFPRIREICTQYDVLMAADEVITGFGRTGTMFGLTHWGVEPDLFMFAKAITSGYFPLGGVGISEPIAQVLDTGAMPWMHAYTYSAHPVGCAVGLRMLDLIEAEQFPQQAGAKGQALLQKLQTALSDHPHVGEVRGKGLMCGIEFVQDKKTKALFPAADGMGNKVLAEALNRGLFSRLRGQEVFLVAPPIITPNQQLDQIVEILKDSIRAALG